MALSAGRGIALCEVPLASGPCDCLPLVDRKPVGVLEAKKVGTKFSDDQRVWLNLIRDHTLLRLPAPEIIDREITGDLKK